MVVNLQSPKPVEDVGEVLLRTSVTPPTIPEMLAATRARYGTKLAFQTKRRNEWQQLTFDELWQESQGFAAGLLALGLKKGDRVAIMCESGLPWIVGVYGLFLAGGVSVPIYSELKGAEAEQLIDRAGARILIVSAKALDRLGDSVGDVEHVIVVGDVESREGTPPRFLRKGRPSLISFDDCANQATDAHRAALEDVRTATEDLAAIIFTSGTTGGMKGVMLTHRNLTSNVESVRRFVEAEPKDRLLLVLPMHHAFPFILMLTATAVGSEVTMESDLLRVRDRMQETKPTIFVGVPALFDQMYRAIVRRAEMEGRIGVFNFGLRVVDVAKRRTGVNLGRLVFREIHKLMGGELRFVLSGGAALKPETARAFFKLGIPLFQGWGMTEASPALAAQRMNSRKFFFSNHYDDLIGTVGPAVDGVEVKLIDVPQKEIYVHLHGEGELVVRGPNIFAGYWQSPEATSAVMEGDWLRTGDLGRIDDKGNIFITGRSKFIIVLDSGEKVVPDELEERYGESPLLEDISVVGRQIRDKTQVGMIVYPNVDEVRSRLGDEVTEESVRQLLKSELDAIAHELAPHKRISDLVLSDMPLPKTALQDVVRGLVADDYSFDIDTWLASAVPAEEQPDSTDDEA